MINDPYAGVPASQAAKTAYSEEIKCNAKQTVNVVNGNDIEIEPINWYWPGWLAAGKFIF
jgi:hypothetical protein